MSLQAGLPPKCFAQRSKPKGIRSEAPSLCGSIDAKTVGGRGTPAAAVDVLPEGGFRVAHVDGPRQGPRCTAATGAGEQVPNPVLYQQVEVRVEEPP